MAQGKAIAGAARRLGVAFVVGLCALSGSAATTEREAGACSCAGPQTVLVAPDRADDVPLNARIRVDALSPAHVNAPPRLNGASSLVLRVYPTGAVVPTTLRTFAAGGQLAIAELVPSALLAPATQYDVALHDALDWPTTTVVGTFRTAKTSDTTAPRIHAVGAATAFKSAHTGGTCEVAGPWVTIEGISADDPGRPDAQLLYAVWLGDSAGNVDTKKPPTALVRAHDGMLELGQTSLCDAHDFPIAKKAAFMWLGIAAIDEAGNTSAERKVRVDLAGARPR
jgi:hypothetical protein